MTKINPQVELRHAMTVLEVEPKCSGAEYTFVDYTAPPTRLEAQRMCGGCPLLELCDAAAQAKRPAWGVWGGRVYGVSRKVLKSA